MPHSIAYCTLAGMVAYLLGSIPTGYWLGKGPALVVLLIDLLKGVAAVAFARWLYSLPVVMTAAPSGVDVKAWLPWALTGAALLAILGHSRSIWIQFTGGKSAATGLGVLLAMSWQVGLGVAITFGATLAVSRIVSLSSIAAAGAAVALMVIFREPAAFLLMAVVGAAYIVSRHTANIQRLLVGTEPRIGQSSRSL